MTPKGELRHIRIYNYINPFDSLYKYTSSFYYFLLYEQIVLTFNINFENLWQIYNLKIKTNSKYCEFFILFNFLKHSKNRF